LEIGKITDLAEVRKTLNWIFKSIGVVCESQFQRLRPLRISAQEIGQLKTHIRFGMFGLEIPQNFEAHPRLFNMFTRYHALCPESERVLDMSLDPIQFIISGTCGKARACVWLAISETSVYPRQCLLNLRKSSVHDMGLPLKPLAGVDDPQEPPVSAVLN
jgi:hypothetical protein